MSAILSARGLSKSFGAVTAAADITVEIVELTSVGLIGANGAGKTTFINMMTGYLKPTQGTIHYAGRDITALSPRRITQLGVARSFQIPQLFNTLSVHENLKVAAEIAENRGQTPISADASAQRMLEGFSLGAYRNELAGVLPEGVRKLLDIAMALVVKPKVILLDEPTSGVAAEEKFGIMDVVMNAVKNERVTVLFVEHDMDIVSRYADRVLAFYDGRVIADGAPREVLDAQDVRTYVTGETLHVAGQ